MEPYKLKEVSEEASLSIFVRYAFSEGEEKAHPLLVEMGRSIIKKCRGVPLAAKTLGSLLRHKRDYRDWERIEESELWEIDQGPDDILPALKLSFDHAPRLLRLCFASCAIFGKGCPLYRSDLISLWIAHGFLQCGDGSTEDALDLGNRCFDELISRSFFQLPDYINTEKDAMILEKDFSWKEVKHSHRGYEDAISKEFRSCDGKVICVEMHDLLHDLASYVAREETAVVGKRTDNVSIRTRHLVWDGKQHLAEDFPMDLLRANKARTFAFLYPMDNISKSFLETLISNFRCLRILIFSCCTLKMLPESIGNLKHLRYLDLRGNSLLSLLPRSVCNLVNLNVLDLGKCECLEILPANAHRLISLRILRLTFRSRYLEERAIQGWNSLQVLKLMFCPNLEFLSEEFGSLQSLRVLIIRECNSLVDLTNSISSLANLEQITLESCRQLSLKEWRGLHNLVRLQVLVFDNLPELKEIPGMGNASRSLQYLKLSNCNSFGSLPVSIQDCTSLLKLQVFSCPNLKSLPSGIQDLRTLQELIIIGCPELSQECERVVGKYWHLIKYIPLVYIDIDEKASQSSDVTTKQVQAGTLLYPTIESFFDSNLDDTKGTTLKSGGESLSNQTERQSPISPDEVTQLTSPTPTDTVPVWKEYQNAPHGTTQDPAMGSCFDSNVDDNKETTLKYGVSEGDANQTEHLTEHIPEVYNDEKFIQSRYATKQVQAGTFLYPTIESCFNSNVDDSKGMTLKSSVSGGESLSKQTEHQSPISPDKISQLTSPTPTETVPVWKEYQNTPHAAPADGHLPPTLGVGPEIQGTDDDYNKEEAKRLLFLFGEGYEFEKQMLIQLWMALGLLAVEPMEENGAYYFENLVSEGYILCCLANSLYKVNLEKLGTELNIENHSYIKLDNTRQNNDSSAETLHASVICDEIDSSVFQTLQGFDKLRTLMFLGSNGSRLQKVPRDIFLCYESLEILDLSGTHIKELPSSAGKMINLRYLDLSWTFLEFLPERIDHFKKLQTLKLEGCSRLRRLPNEMKGLTDLRHLHLDVLGELSSFPEGMGALVNLRTLSAFPVGIEQGLQISELKNLDNITGSFCIAKIENVRSADVAKEAMLNNKKNIKKLKLRWSNHKMKYSRNEAECILQNLCPWSDLEEIEIECYPGIKLPDWIADVSFDKLVSISLFGCANVNMLPSIGKLLSLKSLELISFNSVTKLGFKGVEADYVAFPKLQKLSVEGMLNLKTWAEAREVDYPCIEELSIKDCPKLGQFPSVVYAPTLKHLEASGCKKLVLKSDETLPNLEQLIVEDCPLMEERCSKDGGQDWHKIQHVPTIWVNQVAVQQDTACTHHMG